MQRRSGTSSFEFMSLPKPYYEEPGITIYCGDCRTILPDLPQFDLVLTDPPYGVGYKYNDYDDDPELFKAWMPPFIPIMLAKGNCCLVTTGMKNAFLYPAPKWMLCWAKPGSTRRSSLGGFSEWEPVFVYGKPHAKIYNDLKIMPDCTNHSKETQDHPCPKPINLFQWLVDCGCPEGGQSSILSWEAAQHWLQQSSVAVVPLESKSPRSTARSR